MRSDARALVNRGVLDGQPVDVRLRQAIAQIPLELVEPGDPVHVRQRTHLEPQLVALFGRHGQILASAGDGGNRVRTAYHEVHRSTDGAWDNAAVEIGRASSRERVCQYVKISVVAVSVKK